MIMIILNEQCCKNCYSNHLTGQCSSKPDQEFKRTQLQPLHEGMRVFPFLRGGEGHAVNVYPNAVVFLDGSHTYSRQLGQ